MKLVSRTAKAKKALTPAQKGAATRKANALKAKRSAAAKKAVKTRLMNVEPYRKTSAGKIIRNGLRRANRKAATNAKSKKKTTKGATKKHTATKKTATRKRKHVDGRSREARTARGNRTYLKECAKLLLKGKLTDAEIRDKLSALFGDKYSGAKHTRHIRKYRSLLNSGGLEDMGFARPPKPIQEVGRTTGTEKAGLSKRQVRTRRREIREKKVGPRARFAQRRLQSSSVDSSGAEPTGNTSDGVQPTARRARRR